MSGHFAPPAASSIPRQCDCIAHPVLRRGQPWGPGKIWQHRKEAVRAKVAQRISVERGPALDDVAVSSDTMRATEEVASSSSTTAGTGVDGEELGIELARVVNDVKAGDIRLLHVAELVYWTSYLLIVSVFSRPQLQAALVRMQRRGQELGREPSVTPAGKSAWEVLDYGDVVVHVLTPEQRDFYDLESFYGAAEEIELPFLKEEPKFGGNWAKAPPS
ncbi:g12506 [Coccomyxa viridis]|uniref:G12506 protein n=1 Tax=Coccomyxa viridis TaxID=1274662 RepID=A0ABP1GG07_9CHLO